MIKSPCKNCSNPTIYPDSCPTARKDLEYCYPCYRAWAKGQAIKKNIKEKKDKAKCLLAGNLKKSDKIEEIFCRNCAMRSNGRPSLDGDRLKERLCKRCFDWWKEDPDSDDMYERLINYNRRKAQGRV